MNPRYFLASALLVTCLAPSSWAVDWNVNAGGNGDFPTIQAAFDGAAPGDRIILAPGTYQDSNTRLIAAYDIPILNTTTAVAHMSPGVSITSSGGAEVTFIDGQNARHGLVGADLGPVEVSGMTFTNCRSNGNGGGTEIWGGGFLSYRSEVTLQENRFTNNTCLGGGGGGGALIHGSSQAIVRYNLFLNNTTDDLAGGLALLEGTASISNNTFVGNYALDRGGAFLSSSGVGTLSNNIFTGNSAGVGGGAVGCINSHFISGGCNVFWNNSAPSANEILSCGLATGVLENVIADPQFCAPASGNYTLQSNSIAAPTDPSGCGLRGAYGVGCGPVSISDSSWGQVKAHYR